MKKIVIKEKKEKIILMAVANAIMLAIGAFIIVNGVFNNGMTQILIGIACVWFFTMTMFYILRRIFNPRPIVVIQSEGFVDSSHMSSVGFVPWSDVTAIEVKTIAGQTFVNVDVVNPDKVLEGLSSKKRLALEGNMKLGHSAVTIRTGTAEKSTDDIMKYLNKYWNEWKAKSKETMM